MLPPAGHPKVSVILPTYNRAHTLRRAIDGVLAQTFGDLELLVVDDGSTDGTRELIGAYDDPRLRFVQPGRRGGAGAARNRGIEAARGEFIAFQDSDDAWLVQKLEKQIAHLQAHPQAAVGAAGYINVLGDGVSCGYCGASLMQRDYHWLILMRYGYQISTPAWLVRREALDRAGMFDESLHTWEDWDLSIRLDAAGGFVHLDEPLHIAFESGGSVKMNVGAYARASETILAKYPQWLTRSRRVLSRHAWMVSHWEREAGRGGDARRHLMQALRLNPANLRAWATLVRRHRELVSTTH